MRGIKPADYRPLAERDVELVKAEAAHLFTLDQDSCNYRAQTDPGLGIIAVIGQSENKPLLDELEKYDFGQVNLLEVGIGKSRPYHPASLPQTRRSEAGIRVSLPKRRKWFGLSASQYGLLAPQLFPLLQDLADRQVAARRCHPGNPFILKFRTNYYQQSIKKYSERQKSGSFPQGIRFSVNLQDDILLNDLYWSTLLQNKQVQQHISGLANYIHRCLNRYRHNQFTDEKFARLRGVENIQPAISSCQLPDWLKREMLHCLPGGNKYHLFELLLAYLELDLDEYKERKRVRTAQQTDPKCRLGGIQLRVLREIDDYAVFEVSASDNHRRYLPVSVAGQAADEITTENESDDSDDSDDIIPF